MTTPTQNNEELIPLDRDALIEERVSRLIGRASIRQLWLLFLDEDSVQLPVMIPIDSLPSRPSDEHVAGLVGNIEELMEGIGAASVVVVWERYGPPALSAADAEWARVLHAACDDARVPVRAMLLSHRAGVRWIAQDDYRF